MKSYMETMNKMAKEHNEKLADGGADISMKHENIKVDSTSDERTVNNTMRHQYRVLSDDEKANMQAVKDSGLIFHQIIEAMGNSRELSIAKTKIEEAVMWAVKHITK